MTDTTFAALGCTEPFLAALAGRGFTTPTSVQEACFAPGCEGRDLLVQSRTGSGKTLAFGLPLMHRLDPNVASQALILTPTRELAQQVAEELKSVQPNLDVALLVGGLSYVPQIKALKHGASVIVGTPGRVQDHIDQGTLKLANLRMVVLDECDEMLAMGFVDDVEKILSAGGDAPRQTYLFSATLPGPIASLAKRFLNDPVRLTLTGGEHHAHADITHTGCLVADHFAVKALVNLLSFDNPSAALVFVKMKAQAEEVAQALRDGGLAADAIHGDLGQSARIRVMTSFKEGKLHVLVATDVAARGIDIQDLPLVVHMGIPTQLEPYTHRSGRTGRAGKKGTSLALVNPKESRILRAWSRRGGFELTWRPVPTPDEIRVARAERLGTELDAWDGFTGLEAARALMKGRNPEAVVSFLLSRVEKAHEGFAVPPPPRVEPFKPFPDKKPYGDRKPFEDRKPFGDKKPYGERTPYGDKKPYADRGPRKEWTPRPEGADRPERTEHPGSREWRRPGETAPDASSPAKGPAPKRPWNPDGPPKKTWEKRDGDKPAWKKKEGEADGTRPWTPKDKKKV